MQNLELVPVERHPFSLVFHSVRIFLNASTVFYYVCYLSQFICMCTTQKGLNRCTAQVDCLQIVGYPVHMPQSYQKYLMWGRIFSLLGSWKKVSKCIKIKNMKQKGTKLARSPFQLQWAKILSTLNWMVEQLFLGNYFRKRMLYIYNVIATTLYIFTWE